MKVHELKTWPGYYDSVVNGNKRFELRKDDRDFEVGDILHLREYDPELKKYLDSSVLVKVDYILRNCPQIGLEKGYCIMSISLIMIGGQNGSW